MEEKFIIDTDPGVDDTAAIFWLLSMHPESVLAFTTVFGNVEVEQTSRNMGALLTELGRSEVPLYQGCAGPLVGAPNFAKHVHGDSGVGGFVSEAEPRAITSSKTAPVAILDILREHPAGDVSLLALGPLTNLAVAYRLEPETFRRARRIIFMGGAVRTWGNASPRASANLFNDPDAASVVMDAGVPLVQVGLDICRQFVVREEGMDRLNSDGGRMGEILFQMINGTYEEYDRPKGRHPKTGRGVYFNDAPCVGFILYPEMFDVEDVRVRIERHGQWTRGETVADMDGLWGEEPNVRLCLDVDGDKLAERFVEDIASR